MRANIKQESNVLKLNPKPKQMNKKYHCSINMKTLTKQQNTKYFQNIMQNYNQIMIANGIDKYKIHTNEDKKNSQKQP